MNRDQIKLIAVIAMTFNHAAFVFLAPGTALFELFVDIGYLTAPTMLYFLAEGYRRTSSLRNYALRLAVFAAAAQIPFLAAFGMREGNMLVTLLICLLILAALERIANPAAAAVIAAGLALLTYFCDWGIFAPVAAVLFFRAGGRKKQVLRSCLMLFALQFAMQLSLYGGGLRDGSTAYGEAALHSLLASVPVLASGALILFAYNGKKARRGALPAKWFFYLYYPAHLVVLCLIRRWI